MLCYIPRAFVFIDQATEKEDTVSPAQDLLSSSLWCSSPGVEALAPSSSRMRQLADEIPDMAVNCLGTAGATRLRACDLYYVLLSSLQLSSSTACSTAWAAPARGVALRKAHEPELRRLRGQQVVEVRVVRAVRATT